MNSGGTTEYTCVQKSQDVGGTCTLGKEHAESYVSTAKCILFYAYIICKLDFGNMLLGAKNSPHTHPNKHFF